MADRVDSSVKGVQPAVADAHPDAVVPEAARPQLGHREDAPLLAGTLGDRLIRRIVGLFSLRLNNPTVALSGWRHGPHDAREVCDGTTGVVCRDSLTAGCPPPD